MGNADIFGFPHEDLEGARRAIEKALSIRLEEAPEDNPPIGSYYRWYVPEGPCVQLRRNSGPHIRWRGDPSHLWYPQYGLLVWLHGSATESIAERLRHDVPGLIFLETR
jgi:hypothetical protein